MTRGAAARTVVSRHVVLIESGGAHASFASGHRCLPRRRPAHASAASRRPLLQLAAVGSRASTKLRMSRQLQNENARRVRNAVFNQHCSDACSSAELRFASVSMRCRGWPRAFARGLLFISQKQTTRPTVNATRRLASVSGSNTILRTDFSHRELARVSRQLRRRPLSAPQAEKK